MKDTWTNSRRVWNQRREVEGKCRQVYLNNYKIIENKIKINVKRELLIHATME